MHRLGSHILCRNIIPKCELEAHYDALLQSYNSLPTLGQIHSSLTTTGFIRQSPHLGARILLRYTKFGHSEKARHLFDNIPNGPNSFLWNTMLRAYTNGSHFSQTLVLYSLMRKTGIKPNNYTYPFVLKACAAQACVVEGNMVHCDVIRTGFDSDVHVEAGLVDMYAKCGAINEGRKVFDEMSSRDVVCWTAMITAYEQAERAESALNLFYKMQQEGLSMDSITAVTVASAVGQLGDTKKALTVHGYVILSDLVWDVCVGNSIIAMYAKCGEVEKALLVFDDMRERDGITWNSMLSCYIHNGLASEALFLFDKMQASDVKPNPVTALVMVSACAFLGSKNVGKKIHDFIVTSDMEIDVMLHNAIMDMYAKCGDLGTCLKMFDRTPSSELNASSWNALISGYGMHGLGREALEIFTRMKEEGVEPNHITFTSVLSACSHVGLIDEGRRCFAEMEKSSVIPEAKHYACMVDMLGRAGRLHETYELIKKMPSQPSDAVWGALLLACRIHGYTDLGKVAANQLFHLEPEHTGYYVLMSNIYAASSKWQEVGKLRQYMKNKGLRKPAAFSVIEFGDEVYGFHTADQLNPFRRDVYRKVEALAEEMKMAGYMPDRSCVLHDVEEEDKDQILNYHCEKLAVAFGLMKIEPGLDIHITKNLRVCNDCHSALKIISNIYGRKIVVRDANRFHHFQGGSCSCKDYW
ncbi:hypothetical protein RJ640_020318 [Escallonia rubra]|uniref:DYW domain-containing protein n=1 Tax=Escallonia rubra TaxID=112253 RepID=A0AA88UNR3_9ASTE|nr:hypothetical protein RJ640_020318 [Escallonia rubra]